jgi:hypothetical protein
VATADHGAKARDSPSGQRSASFTPLTKSFAQAIRASEVRKNGGRARGALGNEKKSRGICGERDSAVPATPPQRQIRYRLTMRGMER